MGTAEHRSSLGRGAAPGPRQPYPGAGPSRVLVLQHIACEPPGLYEDVLRERGAQIHRVELDAGEPLPHWRDFDAIVCMGGPMGAYDDAKLPWLADEKAFVAEAVRVGVPFWGVCLGVAAPASAAPAGAER